MDRVKQNNPLAKGRKGAYSDDAMALEIRAVSDIVFKFIFGTEESVELLKGFVNAVLLDAGYPPVEELQVVFLQPGGADPQPGGFSGAEPLLLGQCLCGTTAGGA